MSPARTSLSPDIGQGSRREVCCSRGPVARIEFAIGCELDYEFVGDDHHPFASLGDDAFQPFPDDTVVAPQFDDPAVAEPMVESAVGVEPGQCDLVFLLVRAVEICGRTGGEDLA